jgi:hypothetical protein
MKPSIGRVVHYVAYGTPGGEYPQACRAAIITHIDDAETEDLSLCVMNPTGLFFNRDLKHDEAEKPGGTWHWPELLAETIDAAHKLPWDGKAVGPGTPDGGK